MKNSGMGELSLVKHIRESFFKTAEGLIVGIGDDAAVLKPPRGLLTATTDAMMEGVHFDLSYCTLYQVGYKLVSVNVSDIYAMGGRPLYMLLSLAIPKERAKLCIDEFLNGLRSALTIYDTTLVGGDVTSSQSGLALSATLIGVAENSPVMRAGAKPGDRVYVTGQPGNSAAGLQLLKKIRRQIHLENAETIDDFHIPWSTLKPLITRHLMPTVKHRQFTENINAMIDISDGLSIDLRRLCTESGVGCRLYENYLPVSNELTDSCSYLGVDPIDLCLCGGEDYEYLFTCSSAADVTDAVYIGDIVKEGITIVTKDGNETELKECGYVHFED
ncbi:MAG: thiamine-phosphate kinase [Nitrospirae bacterium YQR-1]